MYLTLLTSELRLLARLVTDLPGTVTCWTSQGWRERVGTEEWKKKATSPAFLFFSYGVHNHVHTAFFDCPSQMSLLCSLVKQGAPLWSIRQIHQSHFGAWEKQLSGWKFSWLLPNCLVHRKFISRLADGLAVLLWVLSQYWFYLLQTNWFSM